jgi:hypothetical protein
VHVGIDSFVSAVVDPQTGHRVGPEERIEHLLEEIALADGCGLYSFGIGEHHREAPRRGGSSDVEDPARECGDGAERG